MSKFSDEKLSATKFEDISGVTRGETPPDVQEKCLKLCAEYLGGVWNDLDSTKSTVRRISGGYTNQLYFCGLNDDISTIDDEPREVAVKFYGQKYFGSDERLSDMVIVLLASEKNVGPKVFGVFNEGEITEYIPSHQFRLNDQANPILVKEVAKKLAQFHSLDIPLAKDSDWLQNHFNNSYEKAYKDFPIDDIIREIKAENLLKRNVKQEYEWLLKCMKHFGSPVVFAHNDYRGSNILVHDIVNPTDPRLITLCDFDYSCYYYRGFDLGVCLDEFGRKEFITFEKDLNNEMVDQFVSGYLEESIAIHGEEYILNEHNSKEQLIKEAKIFSLASDMFAILFLFSTKEIPFCKNKNDIMVGADRVFAKYLMRKNHFQSLGLLPNV